MGILECQEARGHHQAAQALAPSVQMTHQWCCAPWAPVVTAAVALVETRTRARAATIRSLGASGGLQPPVQQNLTRGHCPHPWSPDSWCTGRSSSILCCEWSREEMMAGTTLMVTGHWGPLVGTLGPYQPPQLQDMYSVVVPCWTQEPYSVTNTLPAVGLTTILTTATLGWDSVAGDWPILFKGTFSETEYPSGIHTHSRRNFLNPSAVQSAESCCPSASSSLC